MPARTRPAIRTLLDNKEIRRYKLAGEAPIRELDAAIGDLEAAKLSLKNGDYKWTTIQAYHSMFHTARALLNRTGYREQSPRALLAALHQLYEKEIVDNMLRDFSKAMSLTEQAHDSHIASKDSAQTAIENAIDFLEEAARILAAPREWFERRSLRRRVSRSGKR